MSAKVKNIESKLKNSEINGHASLKNTILNIKGQSNHAQNIRVISWLSKSKIGNKFLASPWIIHRDLFAYPTIGHVELSKEIEWASVLLGRFISNINEYITFKKDFQLCVLHSNWPNATKLLDEFERSNSASMSTIEMRLALLQNSEGTLSQVSYARRLENKSSNFLFTWFLKLTSWKNEEHVSYVDFHRQVNELLDASKLTASELALFKWHSFKELPDDFEILASLLNNTSSTSIFDFYEVYVAACVHLTASNALQEINKSINDSNLRLLSIKDHRIQNLDKILNEQINNINFKEKFHPFSASSFISENLSYEDYKNLKINCNEESTLFIKIENNINILLNDTVSVDITKQPLHKLAANFYHLPLFNSLFEFVEHTKGSKFQDRPLSPILAFNSKALNFWHLLGLPNSKKISFFKKINKTTFNTLLTAEVELINTELLSCDELANSGLLLELAINQSQNENSIFKLENTTKKILSEGRIFEYTHSLRLLINACVIPQNTTIFLESAAILCMLRPDYIRNFQHLKSLIFIKPVWLNSIDALHFCVVATNVLKNHDDDYLQDKLMVAIERIITNWDSFIENLSTNPLQNNKFWVNFLFEVLIPENFGFIDGITSQIRARTCRSIILRHLMDIDNANLSLYENELKGIAFELVLDEGMRHVDQSRLYVNLEGLTKWAQEQIRGDIERYRDLAKVDVIATFGDTPSAVSMQAGDLLTRISSLPRVATDDQLIHILMKVKHAYLSEPRYGLDGFMSLRVRHGSLAGTLGSGFDEEKLLVLRSTSVGGFGIPVYWISELELTNQEDIEKFAEFFKNFAVDFQKLIDDLLNNKVRIKNDVYPNGYIDIEITQVFLQVLKIDLASDISFENILNSIFLNYKNAVAIKLHILIQYLQNDFLNQVSKAAEELSQKCNLLLNKNSNASRLTDAITAALINFRISLNKVCGWLQVAHKDDLSQLFSIEQVVLIAVDYTRKVRVGFEPIIEKKFDDFAVNLTGQALVILVDALFILLDNVFRHAGGASGRKILIEILFINDVISLYVENDLAPHIDEVKIMNEIAKIEALLESSASVTSHMNEGGSGFPKLKRLASPNHPNSLQIKFLNKKFSVKLLLPYESFEAAE